MSSATTTLSHSNIEDVLYSEARLKILKLLAQSGPLTVSDVARKVGVNYASAFARLEVLENQDVLSHVTFGKRIRYYKFKESARARAVKTFIEVWSIL